MSEDPVDRLYGLPLEDFVRERDALARELRRAGDREAADAVKRLAKPSRAAGALNRLVRERPDEVRGLVEAGEALAGAQDELLGGAPPRVLRDAVEAARRLVDALAAEAAPEGPTREKVRASLHAATVDPEARAELASGRVVRERVAAGFGGLDAALAGAAPRGRAAGARRRKDRSAGAPPP
ncbi:MAG TPA: hypothetical protein VFT50_05160, partial [Baekduia sp.]|nr:hypothetical protein [Baekduia sp.]